MSNPDNVANTATVVAGSAAVSNAIFNSGTKRQEIFQAIFIFYILFGGFYAVWLYTKNIFMRRKQLSEGGTTKHIILPILSSIGGALLLCVCLWLLVTLRSFVPTGFPWWAWTIGLLIPTVIWGVFSSWCFEELERVNNMSYAPQLVSSKATAFWLQVGFISLLVCTICLIINPAG